MSKSTANANGTRALHGVGKAELKQQAIASLK
jgi:hypothetical protein